MKINQKLTIIGKIVPTKCTMPILSSVLIRRISDTILEVTGTDLEIAVRAELPARFESSVEIVVPFKAFKAMYSDNCCISQHENSLIIDGQKLPGENSREYPSTLFELAKYPVLTDISPAAIEAVTYAVSTDHTRFNLNGVSIGAKYAVATDGHRLAMRPINSGKAAKGQIVPAAAARLADRFDSLSLTQWDNPKFTGGQFASEGIKLAYRAIDGEFPDYSQAVPSRDKATTILSGVAVKPAIEQLERFIKRFKGEGEDKKTGEFSARFDVSDHVRISRDGNPDAFKGEFNGYKLQGDPECFGMNARYLLEALKAVEGPTVDIRLIANAKQVGTAGLLSPVLIGDDVVMPMRLAESE